MTAIGARPRAAARHIDRVSAKVLPWTCVAVLFITCAAVIAAHVISSSHLWASSPADRRDITAALMAVAGATWTFTVVLTARRLQQARRIDRPAGSPAPPAADPPQVPSVPVPSPESDRPPALRRRSGARVRSGPAKAGAAGGITRGPMANRRPGRR